MSSDGSREPDEDMELELDMARRSQIDEQLIKNDDECEAHRNARSWQQQADEMYLEIKKITDKILRCT